MTLVSGPLSTVTTTPSSVSQVEVSVSIPRTSGSGLITTEQKVVSVSGGSFSSQITPGNASIALIIAGKKSVPIPILVDDVASQTLAEVVDAARLATGETQESLAEFVQQVLSARTEVLGAAGDVASEKNAALSGIGTAKNTALTEIGVEVTKAEDAADRAESDATQTGLDRIATGEDRQAAAQSANEAATHEDTSLDAAAAAIAAAVSVAQFQGHGFPNGSVTAPVGSIYTDLDATAGAIRWIKTSGTGNTGWQVEYGDTGWRDVTSLLINGWTATAFRIKRAGDLVYWKAIGLNSANATSRNFLSATTGISPGEFMPIEIDGVKMQVEWNGVARTASASYQGLNLTDHSIIITSRNQAWPSTLPGLPA